MVLRNAKETLKSEVTMNNYMKEKDQKKYEAILNYDYRGVKTRQPMSLYNRAAQFAPFAALGSLGDTPTE